MRQVGRFAGVLAVLGVGSALCIGVLLVPGAHTRRRVAQRISALVSRCLLATLGVTCAYRGPRPRGGALLMANHLSWLDIVAIVAAWPCAFVAKREVSEWPVIGPLARVLGAIFVDRHRKRDLLRAIPALTQSLRDGAMVLLFPEGTTTYGESVTRFRSALVQAAVEANVPLFPVALSGRIAERDSLVWAPVVCWCDDETLLSNVWRLAGARGVALSLHVGAPVEGTGDRKRRTVVAQEQVTRRFVPVQVVEPPRAVRLGIAARLRQKFRVGERILARSSGVVAPLLALLIALSAGCALTPLYRFPEPQAFVGEAWYNPYDRLDGRSGQWRRANFHAHSAAWGGVTRGNASPEQVAHAYRQRRYDVIGVSNYQWSPDRRPAGTFPVYEHGWNARKAHHLVFRPDRVVWMDYPLLRTRDQQQHMLASLSRSAALVAIAHPRLRGGYSASDLRVLTDYDMLEVLTRYSAPADAEWDAALSSGHPVWMLASDDSHNVNDSTQVGINTTHLFSTDASDSSVITALRAGRAYGVHMEAGGRALTLRTLRMRDDSLEVQLDGAPERIRVLGQNGALRAIVTGAAARGGRLTAAARASDGYLRVIAERDGTLLYSNPVFRWDGRDIARATATIDGPRTALWRSAWTLAYAALCVRLLLTRRRARTRLRPAPITPTNASTGSLTGSSSASVLVGD